MKSFNKKGVSLMVSYTLLIIIAIGLSVAVFVYLKTLLPSDRKQCPTNTMLIIEDASCTFFPSGEKELRVTFSNRGLFNVSAAYVRMGKSYRDVKDQVNPNKENLLPPLLPGNSTTYLYNITDSFTVGSGGSLDFSLEVQPAIISKRVLTPCETVISQPITCVQS